MQSQIGRVARGIFGTLLVGALGFGATQALASPAARMVAGGCLKADAAACNAACREALGPGHGGWCTMDDWGEVACECFPLTLPGES